MTVPPPKDLSELAPSGTLSNVEFSVEGDVKTAKIKNPIKDERSLKPTVDDLTVSEPVTVDKIAEKLEIYGGAIVKNHLSEEIVDKMWDDISPHFKKRTWNGDFFPQETLRVTATVCKSKTVAEDFMCNPLFMELCARFIGKKNTFVIGDELTTAYSEPQHCSSTLLSIGPGAKDQPYHRDDIIHHNICQYREKYEYGHETAIACAIAHNKATKANGATRFVPGSHLWDHQRVPKPEEAVYAEIEKGDAFFMLASCFHGGSANTTKDEWRNMSFMFMTQGLLRQEINIFLETPLEYFQSLSVQALKSIGVAVSQPFCGWYRDLEDPLKVMKPESSNGSDDIENAFKLVV
ncbi:unnamed protein product [Kuraishia capsulata CBS 1993]|uniref:Uncharacterized protein n=1 Tax=Kuraishia capsulata CBS 1993 TaxID=1382522 RepID=W6MI97_9ASCO|nr:uncharacterized protein KUCA_T00000007001 [Kuraishia capsulata CBS 1993]CDK24047.1 unnamed protein product [Kuraishia capsulata CBS 1993]